MVFLACDTSLGINLAREMPEVNDGVPYYLRSFWKVDLMMVPSLLTMTIPCTFL